MNTALILLTLFFATNSPRESIWTKEELAMANTAANIDYLTEPEKKTIMLVNLARLDGTRYLQSYFAEYNSTSYDEMRTSNNSYMKSLRKDLDAVKNLTMLQPEKGLNQSAKYHAKDSGKNGLVGHDSSNGTAFGKRISKYVKGWNMLAENCSYGYEDAGNIVGQLLLDENVPSLGHRKSIINPKLEYIGVSIQAHSDYRFNCVMDFCAKFDN